MRDRIWPDSVGQVVGQAQPAPNAHGIGPPRITKSADPAGEENRPTAASAAHAGRRGPSGHTPRPSGWSGDGPEPPRRLKRDLRVHRPDAAGRSETVHGRGATLLIDQIQAAQKRSHLTTRERPCANTKDVPGPRNKPTGGRENLLRLAGQGHGQALRYRPGTSGHAKAAIRRGGRERVRPDQRDHRRQQDTGRSCSTSGSSARCRSPGNGCKPRSCDRSRAGSSRFTASPWSRLCPTAPRSS